MKTYVARNEQPTRVWVIDFLLQTRRLLLDALFPALAYTHRISRGCFVVRGSLLPFRSAAFGVGIVLNAYNPSLFNSPLFLLVISVCRVPTNPHTPNAVSLFLTPTAQCTAHRVTMSRNGELCLQKIIVSYSPNKGNPAMRQFMATYLPEFHRQYPQVKIDIRPRQWPESSITGVYRDGSEKALSIRFLSSMGINVRFHRLVNDANDYSQPFSASHMHLQRKSVQGTWNPYLWNFEGRRVRGKPPAQWDRKLTEEEWDYFVQQYGAQVKAEEDTIADRVRRYTDIPEASTEEVQQRWKEHIVPRLQTDLEYNLNHWKKQHVRGAGRPEAPTLNEYSLFSVPDHSALGQDAIDMLRRRETQRVEDWWRERKNQLKPPK